MNKIVEYEHLNPLINRLKLRATQLVLVGGCFDILHLGHVRFLTEAKKYGTVIVALESDVTLKSHKGHLRPIHKQIERAEMLASLETVDYILLLSHFTQDKEYFELVKTVTPQFLVLTEGDPHLENKKKQAKAVGAKIVIVPKISTPSTTQLAKLLKIE